LLFFLIRARCDAQVNHDILQII